MSRLALVVAAPKVGDPSATHKVYLLVAALVVLAGALVWFSVWYWRHTRPETEVLSRLEVMSGRRWWKSDYMDRQTTLDEVREFAGGDGPVVEPDDSGQFLVGVSLAELAAAAVAPPPPDGGEAPGVTDLPDHEPFLPPAEPPV